MQAFDLVIFGGTGDLSMRKLLPALYRAQAQGSVPVGSKIMVCSRKQKDYDQMQSIIEEKLKSFLKTDEFEVKQWQKFSKILQPVLLDLTDLSKGWDKFASLFEAKSERVRLFYLAVIPSIYGSCCKNLSKLKLITENSRLVVEKPLGYDLTSAEAINETMAKYFKEAQIYRIDHYLGKETVQNLLTLRFSNFLFENIWDSKAIDHIQISISEQVGLEGRAGFYDDVGAMRDMVQNHLLQLLCLLAIDSPNQLSSEAIRLEKVKVLKALRPLLGDDINKSTVRGQYVSGLINDKKVTGYLDELDDYQSNTETFVALKVFIDSWRWAGVPFYLRTGKRLKKRSAEIVVQFKSVTHNVYSQSNQKLKPNQLIIKLQPDEKIQLRLMANDIGGGTSSLEPILLNLDFGNNQNHPTSSSYQRLLLDAINGNSTLFIHRDEVKAAWKWVDPIIEHWKANETSPELYSAGSWGPSKSNEIFEKKHQYWHDVNK
ncbi:MAG: glucose-6-phosphate dehydrogenase [Gammaproteobacteria bacterium]|nr:MAG: glucose-6-phosphate dehydrogenase [Gammaproteobacteria bacterium]